MSKITEQDLTDYLELINDGYSQRAACKELEIPRTTMQNFLKRREGNEHLKDVEHSVREDDGDEVKVTKKPRILYYDIETSLAKSYHFNYWKTNIGVKQMIEASHMLSHAWCWGEDGEVFSSILTQKEALAKDDERIVLEAWSLFDQADIIVAHNGKRLDVNKCNGYFLKYGLPKPSPFKVIDTLEIAKKNFNLPFKSLEYLAKFLDVDLKLDAGGIDTWIGCERGDQEALDTMEYYNRGDIITLREIHKRLKGWDNNGVNIALYNDQHDAVCTHCGSDDVSVLSDKFTYTPQRKYQVYRCNSCQAVLRSNTKQGIGNKLVRVI